MKLNFKKQFTTLAFVTGFAAAASSSIAGECRVAEASMDKPGGFPERALTMIVPYGPGGGSGSSCCGHGRSSDGSYRCKHKQRS